MPVCERVDMTTAARKRHSAAIGTTLHRVGKESSLSEALSTRVLSTVM